MKKIFFITLAFFMFSNCKKDEQTESQNGNKMNFSQILQFTDDSDFWIESSLSTGSGLFEEFSLSRGVVGIQAANESETYIGQLTVSNNEIPFILDRYYNFSDTSFSPNEFAGQTPVFEVVGEGVPSFSIEKYVPMQTELTYSGLVNNRLPRNSGITISWTPDANLPDNAKAGFLVFSDGFNEEGESQPINQEVFIVDDSDGQLTIPASKFEVFEANNLFTVMYLKGYNDVVDFEGFKVDFRFIGHSWTTILFEAD
ncbi:MAG: hypothetical protein JJU02_09295 [Cryomorphaceae bacterium]|nr:hypothetical protein [Cryomorphaceae bacterium]